MIRACKNRIIISALRGGSGKTLLSIGILAALKKRGLTLGPFKKGPDFIDAAWLGRAAGHECRHLDTFLMAREHIRSSFADNSNMYDGALIEGNRGLFDGVDSKGSHSTAALAKLLKTPVILVVDCAKVTRTAAAMVLGCMRLDPDIEIKGVILNQIARERHACVTSRAIKEACGLPVLGAIPRLENVPLRQRHLGLIPPSEVSSSDSIIRRASSMVEDYLDLDQIWAVAQGAEPLKADIPPLYNLKSAANPVIGIVRDEAFHFYYPENIEALKRCGAKLVELSALHHRNLPDIDALYVGGGFPEVYAETLSKNKMFTDSLKHAIEQGLPVYAECGGAMLLGSSVCVDGKTYPMADVYPIKFGCAKKPTGHGYTILSASNDNPFFCRGTKLRGHEFHYSYIVESDRDKISYAFKVNRGYGFDGKHDGVSYKNMLASYSHLHAIGTPQWACSIVEAAGMYHQTKGNSTVRNSAYQMKKEVLGNRSCMQI